MVIKNELPGFIAYSLDNINYIPDNKRDHFVCDFLQFLTDLYPVLLRMNPIDLLVIKYKNDDHALEKIFYSNDWRLNMANVSKEDIHNMQARYEALPGFVAYIFDNFDYLPDDTKEKFLCDAGIFMNSLKDVIKEINEEHNMDLENQIMCWEIMFNMCDCCDALELMVLDFKDVARVAKVVYKPIPISWLGRTIRTLNNYIQVYIPDPHRNYTQDMALKRGIKIADEYIEDEKRNWTNWMRGRGVYGG